MRLRRLLKRRTRNDNKARIESIEAYTSIVANLVTALAGMGAFLLYLFTVHADYVKERDSMFSNNWINSAEGCIGCPIDDNEDEIKLNIKVSNGEISGEIHIDDPFDETNTNKNKPAEEIIAILNKSYTHWFMVEGNLTFNGGTVNFWDYREGKKTYFGESKIKLKNGVLYLETTKRVYDSIPKRIVFIENISKHAISEADCP